LGPVPSRRRAEAATVPGRASPLRGSSRAVPCRHGCLRTGDRFHRGHGGRKRLHRVGVRERSLIRTRPSLRDGSVALPSRSPGSLSWDRFHRVRRRDRHMEGVAFAGFQQSRAVPARLPTDRGPVPSRAPGGRKLLHRGRSVRERSLIRTRPSLRDGSVGLPSRSPGSLSWDRFHRVGGRKRRPSREGRRLCGTPTEPCRAGTVAYGPGTGSIAGAGRAEASSSRAERA
jgi:hypothetical protein